ncbi:MAG: hypothetical protein ACI3ZJ_04330 [Bacteroidaceae bacterium]
MWHWKGQNTHVALQQEGSRVNHDIAPPLHFVRLRPSSFDSLTSHIALHSILDDDNPTILDVLAISPCTLEIEQVNWTGKRLSQHSKSYCSPTVTIQRKNINLLFLKLI